MKSFIYIRPEYEYEPSQTGRGKNPHLNNLVVAGNYILGINGKYEDEMDSFFQKPTVKGSLIASGIVVDKISDDEKPDSSGYWKESARRSGNGIVVPKYESHKIFDIQEPARAGEEFVRLLAIQVQPLNELIGAERLIDMVNGDSYLIGKQVA